VSIRVKIDEQLSQILKDPVREAGYEVSSVFDQGLSGKLDEELWPIVQKEGRFLITADKEFGDIRRYPPGTHAGVLLLRPNNESLLAYRDLLKSVLKKYRLETLSGKTAVATSRGIRIRKEAAES
jgi:predicted nuclease of predicted toxin-antitoxin system